MGKTTAKIIDITGKTPAQIELGLTTYLSNGWELLQIVSFSSKVFAILSKTISL